MPKTGQSVVEVARNKFDKINYRNLLNFIKDAPIAQQDRASPS